MDGTRYLKNIGYYEVETQEELSSLLTRGGEIRRCCFQNLDFTEQHNIVAYLRIACLWGVTLKRE